MWLMEVKFNKLTYLYSLEEYNFNADIKKVK